MRLLVTRPEPDNARTAAALRARGMRSCWRRCFASRPSPTPISARRRGPASSSPAPTAPVRWPDHPRRGELLALPVLAVGGSSAEAARAAGFADVSSADGDAADLARLAAQRFSGARQPLLYLAGEDRCGELSVPGLTVRTVVVYRAAEANSRRLDRRWTQGGIDGVLHFSRRSVETYLDCSRDLTGSALKPVHYCLSARAAEPLTARRRHADPVARAAGRGEPACFGHAKALIESSRMAHGRTKAPPGSPGTKRRRPPTVIDLPATEVPSEPLPEPQAEAAALPPVDPVPPATETSPPSDASPFNPTSFDPNPTVLPAAGAEQPPSVLSRRLTSRQLRRHRLRSNHHQNAVRHSPLCRSRHPGPTPSPASPAWPASLDRGYCCSGCSARSRVGTMRRRI